MHEVVARALDAAEFRDAVAALAAVATDLASGHAKTVMLQELQKRVGRYVIPTVRFQGERGQQKRKMWLMTAVRESREIYVI